MNDYDMFWKNGFLHVPDIFNSEGRKGIAILYISKDDPAK